MTPREWLAAVEARLEAYPATCGVCMGHSPERDGHSPGCPVPILREDVPALVAFARAVLDAADDAADDADVPPRGALPPWRAVGTKTIRAYAAIYLRGES